MRASGGGYVPVLRFSSTEKRRVDAATSVTGQTPTSSSNVTCNPLEKAVRSFHDYSHLTGNVSAGRPEIPIPHLIAVTVAGPGNAAGLRSTDTPLKEEQG